MANPEISRRQLIAGGLTTAVVGGAAALGAERFLGGQPAQASGQENSPVIPADVLAELLKVVKERQLIAASKEAFNALTKPNFTGFPESVDASVVDVARADRGFKNTIEPARAFLAEPGGLLVGPDFGSKSGENPYGVNPKGWDAMYESKGHIQPFSPVTQEVMHSAEPFYQNLPEGGFVLFSLGQGTFVFGDKDQYRVDLPHMKNNNYFVAIRGYYGDNKQNTDRNDTVRVTNYVPGHALAMMYEAGNDTNTAFISEGQFKQMLETSHSAGTNYGDGGASKATIVYVDANTGAYDLMQQVEGRFQGGDSSVKLLDSNWQK